MKGGTHMTERELSNQMRELELNRIKKFYEDNGFIIRRILSQNSPSSLILFTEDKDNNERYIEIKFVVKKPDYEPDEDIENFEVEIEKRAVKQVKAELNKLGKKERAKAEQLADIKVQQLVNQYK